MSKKKSKQQKERSENSKNIAQKNSGTQLKRETKHGILAVFFFIFALIFILSMFSGAGPAGQFLYQVFHYLFGVGYPLIPLVFVLLGYSFARSSEVNFPMRTFLGSILFIIASLGLIDASTQTHAGGFLGKIFSIPFTMLFGVVAGILVMGALLLISLFILTDERPNMHGLLARFYQKMKAKIFSLQQKKEHNDGENYAVGETISLLPDEQETALALARESEQGEKSEKDMPRQKTLPEIKEEDIPIVKIKHHSGSYVPPPLSLLEKDRGKPNTGDIKANANIIKRTLQNFGIEVEMDEITIGPTVTRYALKPAEGVKLSRIVALQQDLSLALAAHPIRVEAPIPGKSLVGIEIPNKAKSIIGFASLLDDDKFKYAPKPLTVALGKNISGKSIFVNLAKMPHALIAGATGSGKSVTIHALIASLIYRNGPEDLRMIFVDPKRVELTMYNKIPHLLTPVITDSKKAILALKWAAKEMDRRYDLLESHSVRDIESYHLNIFKKWEEKNKNDLDNPERPEKMPYIVVIIDELADIMQAYPRELEAGIVRLAQMSRAVGIHLVLSTQRPSVNVITGLIKANVPARIALQVASQIDSRTILDTPGAEKLLGAGDMLYMSGEMSSPERIQCAFISEEEVKKVVTYLIEHTDTVGEEINLTPQALNDNSIFSASIDGNDEDDDLYEDARQTVIESGKASTSFLQRKLGIGYARAARLIDILEERGVIGAGNGAKPRDVLEKSVAQERENFS